MNDSVNNLFNDTLECLPLSDKACFLEAVQLDSNTVFYETDLFQYFVADNFNAWEAVPRMMRYWTTKKKIFGNRWLLPLHDLTGNGALDSDDLSRLWEGYMTNGPMDQNGNAIIIFERSRCSKEWDAMDPIQNQRIFFYTMAVATKELQLSPPHCKVIAINVVVKFPNAMFRHTAEGIGGALGCHALLLSSVHTIFMAKRSFVGFFIQFVIPAVVRNLMDVFGNATKCTCDLVFSSDEAREKLAQYHMHADTLPISLGGTWDYSSYISQLEMKRQLGCVTFRNVGDSQPNRFTPHVTNSQISGHQSSSPSAGSVTSTGVTDLSKKMVNLRLPSPAVSQISSPVSHEHLIIPESEEVNYTSTSNHRDLSRSKSVNNNADLQSLQMNFWKHHNLDTQLASTHFAAYTSVRKALFSVRTDLAMNQTGCKLIHRFSQIEPDNMLILLILIYFVGNLQMERLAMKTYKLFRQDL
jgi:hypothetical protein